MPFAATGASMAGMHSASAAAASAGLSAPNWVPRGGSFKELGIIGWLLVDLGLNWGGWALAALLKTEKFYDLVGTGSFFTLTLGSLLVGPKSAGRQYLVTCMAGVWSVRLGYYLVSRVLSVGKDARFDDVKDKPATFFVYWTVQAVWVWVTMLPVLIINSKNRPLAVGPVDVIGLLIYGVGLSLETVADWQKSRFRANPANHDKWIDEGLWSYSRHPNYLGEMMVWWGTFITCARSFSVPSEFVSIVSPLFVMFALCCLSGIPILESNADKRWGHLAEYQQYKLRVPLLVPFLNLNGLKGGQAQAGLTAAEGPSSSGGADNGKHES